MSTKKYWPVFVIVLIWFVFASPYFLKGLVPVPSRYLVTFFPPWSAEYGMALKNNAMPDVVTQIYPWKKITIDSWRHGQVPLWNPYSFSGTPHAANYQTAVFSPVNLLYGIMPFLDAWSISIILQPMLAGLFMYVFLRCLARSNTASLIGAIAFMFCGFITVWMAYGTLGWAVLWLPILFSLVLTHIHARAWWKPVLVAASIAWSFLSGHFQMSMYVLMATTGYISFLAIERRRWVAVMELCGGIIAGLMLAAPQLLLSFDAYTSSVRSELFTKPDGIAWQYLVTFFAPDFYGNPVTRNDWYGYYAEWASYIGVVPLMAALFAIVRRAKHIGFFLVLAVISLLIATPSPFNAFIAGFKIPALSTSYSARIIVLFSFSLAVICAYGIDLLTVEWDKKKISSIYPFILLMLSILAVLWGTVFIVKPFDADKLLIARRNLLFPTALVAGFITLSMTGYLKHRKAIRSFVTIFLVLLTAVDMIRYVVKWMPFDPREYVYPGNDTLAFLQNNAGYNRIFGNLGGEVTNGYGLQGIEGYDAVYQKRYGELIRSIGNGRIISPERSIVKFAKRADYSEQMLRLLGVRYVVHRLSDGRFSWAYPFWDYPYYKSVYRNNHYEVFENSNALPRAFLASSYLVRSEGQQIIDTLFSAGLDPRQQIVLETDPKIDTRSGDGGVSIVRYTPNEVIMQTESDVPKVLFISDVYDPGWKGTVDQVYARIYRADYDFRAMFVPAGQHVVRMVYRPDSFVHGVRIAVAGLGLLAYGIFRMRKL